MGLFFNISACNSPVVVCSLCLQSISCGKSNSHLGTACMMTQRTVHQIAGWEECPNKKCWQKTPPAPVYGVCFTTEAGTQMLFFAQKVMPALLQLDHTVSVLMTKDNWYSRHGQEWYITFMAHWAKKIASEKDTG